MSDKEGKKTTRHSHSPRNFKLPGGVWRYGRYTMNQKRKLFLKKRPTIAGKTTKRTHYKIKPIKGENNGGTRLVMTRKSVSTIIMIPAGLLSVYVYNVEKMVSY